MKKFRWLREPLLPHEERALELARGAATFREFKEKVGRALGPVLVLWQALDIFWAAKDSDRPCNCGAGVGVFEPHPHSDYCG